MRLCKAGNLKKVIFLFLHVHLPNAKKLCTVMHVILLSKTVRSFNILMLFLLSLDETMITRNKFKRSEYLFIVNMVN